VKDLLASERSLTGQYLSGRKQIEPPPRRQVLDCGAAAPLWPAAAERAQARRGLKNAGALAHFPDAVALNETAVAYRVTPANSGFVVPTLKIANATRHNLKNVTVEIPLGRFVALTGVSGSGKTTLVREVLLPALQERLKLPAQMHKPSDRLDQDADDGDHPFSIQSSQFSISGWESLGQVVLVDQSPLGKTPRSNPVVYIGAFDDVRELFAQTDLARQRGLNASAFSFNSGVGQCERCRGAGFEKIEMQFLSDVFIRCPECGGRRYRGHILEVKLEGKNVTSESVISRSVFSNQSRAAKRPPRLRTDSLNTHSSTTDHWSIADLLEATVDDALGFLSAHENAPAGRRVLARLKLLQDVGLGYLRLGQPINTLSGGESQRLKLVSHLAEFAAASDSAAATARKLHSRNTPEEVNQWLADRRAVRVNHQSAIGNRPSAISKPTLFLFDEPTTGLHFDDVRVLLQVFHRLVDAGHSVLVIEHNLDVLKCADWVMDLGPDAGERGGQLIAAGTPEAIAQCPASHTGQFLREVLGRSRRPRPPRHRGVSTVDANQHRAPK
jgi:excinuclease ABC subunit A